MVDNLTADQRRKNMQHIRSKDTSIEVMLDSVNSFSQNQNLAV